MNKRVLSIVGALALLAWTVAGVAAWALTKDNIQITVAEGSAAGQHDDSLALLEDRVDALQADLGSLARTLGENFQRLQENLSREDDERDQQLGTRFQKLAADLAAGRNQARLAETRSAQDSEDVRRSLDAISVAQKNTRVLAEGLRVSVARLASERVAASRPGVPVAPTPLAAPRRPAPERTPAPTGKPTAPLPEAVVSPRAPRTSAKPAPPASSTGPVVRQKSTTPPKPTKRRGFLSFDLPSQTISFEARQRWRIVPSLSRVGFDGKSTMHDFSGVSSTLSGTLEVNLSRPEQQPQGEVRVQSALLDTGNDGRDVEMRKTLDTSRNPWMSFRLTSFKSERIDAKAETVTGLAHGQMTIHGVTRDVDMRTTLRLDRSRRLNVEGEMPLNLLDYKISPPNKLGVFRMEKMVKVWIRLRARRWERK